MISKLCQTYRWEMLPFFHFLDFLKCYTFLKCLEELKQSETGSFLCGTIFNNELTFLVDIGPLWYSISSSVSFSNLCLLKNYCISAIFNIIGTNMFLVSFYCLFSVCKIFNNAPFSNFGIGSWFFFSFPDQPWVYSFY